MKFTENGTVNKRGIRAWCDAIVPRLPVDVCCMLILEGTGVRTWRAAPQINFRALLDDGTTVNSFFSIGKLKRNDFAAMLGLEVSELDHRGTLERACADLAGRVAAYAIIEGNEIRPSHSRVSLPTLERLLDCFEDEDPVRPAIAVPAARDALADCGLD